MKKSHKRMLFRFKMELLDAVHRKHGDILPEANLLVYTIFDGLINDDREYFRGKIFKYHCKLLGLNYAMMLVLVQQLFDFIDSDIEWREPRPTWEF